MELTFIKISQIISQAPAFPSELCRLSNIKLFNINYCVPFSLTRAAYSVAGYNIVRCQNEQIYVVLLIKQTDNVTRVYESTHPIGIYNDSTYLSFVYVPGANKYILSFDIWTDIFRYDLVVVCNDSSCRDVLYSFASLGIPGLYGNDQLELSLSYFYISISTDRICNFGDFYLYWGYLFTVKAYFSLIGWQCSSPPLIVQSYDNETLLKYNLTLSDSYANNICGDDNNWRGIDCTYVSVTSLSLDSYGITGNIPSSLSLTTLFEL
jgi:hypothetical protein